ncbi:hypothetical protein AVEN_238674-1 [Araneus ventricosus]|uniref:Uncharacterized protein n=1 Tax=Araneus ventricosus TaxID=182803 RepID=A0A4Y2BYU9_ARAVE|nr:hypothetical protein AVEN_238674-1 [Araneus ventricosus]
MSGSFYYLTLLISLKALFALAFQDNSTDNAPQTAKGSFGIADNLNSSSINEMSNQTVLNGTEPTVNYNMKHDVAMDRSGSVFNASMNETTVHPNNGSSSKGPEGRSLKDLSPGEEYLLSVASMEDVADGSWENLPFLKGLIKNGIFDLTGKPKDNTMKESSGQASVPNNMMEMMSLMSAMKKADEDDDQKSEEKPTGFLAKLAMDPMNILLAAIIPFSLLLAAVIPVLTNQLMTGIYIPSVYTIATGERKERSVKDLNSTEFFVPILESIASFSAKAFEDVTKEKPDETKVRFVKEVVDKITTFVSQKWMQLFGGLPGPIKTCSHGNCTNNHKSGTDS